MKYISVIFLYVLFLFISHQIQAQKEPFLAQKGVLDLKNVDLIKSENISLVGQWEFYWNQLYEPEDFKNNRQNPLENVYFIPIPEKWTGLQVMGRELGSMGYATYRLRIQLDKAYPELALKLLTIYTSYKLYVDGKLLAKGGVVSKDPKEGKPDFMAQVVRFTPVSKEVEILVQVSNYDYRYGGFTDIVRLGSVNKIEAEEKLGIISNFFLAGAWILMAIYHLGLFLNRRKDLTHLLFGLLCVTIVLRTFNTNEYMMRLIFPDISWSLLVRFEFIGFYPSVLILSEYVHQLFPAGKAILIRSFTAITFSVFLFIILFTPIFIVSWMSVPLQLCSVVLIIDILYLSVVAIIRKADGIWIFILSYSIVVATFINDVLHANNIIQSYYVAPIGAFLFVFSQSYLLSKRLNNVFKKNEDLTQELTFVNRNLNKMVNRQTQKLTLANTELKQRQDELIKILERVQLLNKKIQRKQNKIKRLSLVASKTNTPILITNPNGRVTWVNNAFVNETGYDLSESRGREFGSFLNGFLTDTSTLKSIYKVFHNKLPLQAEIINYRKDGSSFWSNIHITPIFNRKGRLSSFFILLINLTPQKEKEILLEQLNEKFVTANHELEKQNLILEQSKKLLDEKNIKINLQRKELLKEYERKEHSIIYAKNIQNSILIDKKELDINFKENFVLNIPKDIVSGDFYWFARKLTPDTDKIILVVGDCTGHGVPGAFMSMIGINLLNQIVHDKEIHDSNLILDMLKEGVNTTLRQDQTNNRDGMDIAIIVIDKLNHRMEFSGARRPLIYFQDNQIFEIKGDLIYIGGNTGKEKQYFNKHLIPLEKETHIYLFSDGYQDQFGGSRNRKFSPKRMKEVLEIIHKDEMLTQKEILDETVQKWKVGYEQTDDILIVGVKV